VKGRPETATKLKRKRYSLVTVERWHTAQSLLNEHQRHYSHLIHDEQ